MLNIVVGPPCAGKSTYVRERANDGDVIVDYDLIATALGSRTSHQSQGAVRDAALAARAAVINRLLEMPEADSWVIHTRPNQNMVDKYRTANANFVLVDPGLDVCVERSKSRPEGSEKVIRDWYSNPPSIVNEMRSLSNTRWLETVC